MLPIPLVISYPPSPQQGGPLSLTVTLRGKKYEVKGAATVADVQKSVEQQAGLAQEQQASHAYRVNDARVLAAPRRTAVTVMV